jgi:hypothetical protein
MMDDDSKKAPSKGQNERTKLNPNMIQQAQKKKQKKGTKPKLHDSRNLLTS